MPENATNSSLYGLTTANGNPVADNQNSLTAGRYGPIMLQDFHLIDKLAHFDRERIPERVVHAKGAGAFGYFEVTQSVSDICKADFLQEVGGKTPVFVRFSTVGGEKGSADSERDPRGFAVKFYTKQGNWDLVGNNTPVFFIRDPIKFPDFIHTQKRNPQTNLRDANMVWDFLSLVPESVHQVTILYSDRGIPKGYRFMNGYGSHTFRMVNDKGECNFVKFHLKSKQGIQCLDSETAAKLAGTDPDSATQDLFEAIARGEYPQWRFCVQVMSEARAAQCSFNPFDITKVWPHSEFPLREIGTLCLNQNPQNYFQDVEQAAFSPSHLVPGIEPSPDKMLQARLFSYPDTHRHRLGVNYHQIPVNCPYRAKVMNHQRDGSMCVNGNQGSMPSYEPNSFTAPAQDDLHSKPSATNQSYKDCHPFEVEGRADRYPQTAWKGQDDFVQAGNLYRLMSSHQKEQLVHNIAKHLACARSDIQERQVAIFRKCDPQYGDSIAKLLKVYRSKL
eukprot:Sdes_comp21944_c0_seq1m20486